MKTDIIDELKARGPEPVYLIYGDEFLVKELLHKFISAYLDPALHDTNLTILDGNNFGMGELYSRLFTPSLFGGPQLVVIDQTAIFMGKTDQRKLVGKVLDFWKSGDRKSALRAFGQLANLVGLDTRSISGEEGWIGELLGNRVQPGDVETMGQVAAAFLADGKTVEPSAGESAIEELLNTAFPEGTVLIFTAPDVDRRKKLFKLLDKKGKTVDCSVREERYSKGMERSFFDARVKDTLWEAGKRISPKALNSMYARSGNDLRRLHGELEKLVRFIGDRDEISDDDVNRLFEDFHQAAFFELNNALRSRDISKCLPALYENLKIVAHPLQTLASIATEFRRLLVARELLFTVFRAHWRRGISYNEFKPLLGKIREEHPELAGKGKHDLLSLKEYPVFLYLKDAQRFPMEDLIRIMEALLEADVRMKSSRLGHTMPASIVEELIFEICRPQHSGRKTG
jgi:DNA polymerase III subunit delta